MTMHNPPHPGTVLREWLGEISISEAAGRLGVARVTLSRVLNGAAAISADMDVRLTMALGTTPGFWLRMQAQHDRWHAEQRFTGTVRTIAKVAVRARKVPARSTSVGRLVGRAKRATAASSPPAPAPATRRSGRRVA